MQIGFKLATIEYFQITKNVSTPLKYNSLQKPFRRLRLHRVKIMVEYSRECVPPKKMSPPQAKCCGADRSEADAVGRAIAKCAHEACLGQDCDYWQDSF